ncbi:MAG: hypothetical protein CMM95_01045 [Rickettsiales bacterium]|nr:hypothetical protein [Rickettsiales bacterium]|tara:strand:+ start:233 stop:442 length:210 start_codon:yes stop_codon:yes gene_type:complete
MNEEKLNISIRKFLKNVGITSQRKIEDKIRKAVDSGKVSNSQKIKISAKIVSDDIELSESINGELEIDI